MGFDVAFCVLWHLVFLMAIGEAEKCLAGCQVTKRSFDKHLLTAWVLWICWKQGGHACIRAFTSWQWNYGCMFPGSLCCTWRWCNPFFSFFSVVNLFFILQTVLIHTKTIPTYTFFFVNFLFLLAHHHLVHVCWWCFIPSHSLSFILYSSSCRWWCNSSCLLLTHHPPHISFHITHHNFLITNPFICTKLQTPNSWCASCY